MSPARRLAPGTLVTTPTGQRARVLPHDTEHPNQSCGDAVFVHPLCHPERPWQLWSSTQLTVLDNRDGHG